MATAWSAFLLTAPLDPDYTSGELLDHLVAWRAEGVLYPALDATPPHRVLNYPPLVLALARGLTEVGVPALLAGRLVNGAGLVALVLAVAGWARARGVRGAALAGTVGLLGASVPVLYGAGQLHIELWAAAGTVAGFALLQGASSRRGAVLAGMALALGCFGKQTQVIPGLVALAWAWTHRRRLAPAAVAAFALVGVAGSAAIQAAWGAEAWRHMLVYTVGTFSLPYLGAQMLSHAAPWALLLGLAAVMVGRRGRQAWRDPLVWYGAGALLWSLSAARVGASSAYFLDLHLATALLVGPVLFGGERVGGGGRSGSEVRSEPSESSLGPGAGPRGPSRRLLAAALAVQVVGANLGAAAVLGVNAARVGATARALPELCTLLPERERVLAESPGLLRACGRAPVLHPFIMSSLARQGLWELGPLEEAVAAGAYGPALLPFDPRRPAGGAQAERWTSGLVDAFASAPEIRPVAAGFWLVAW